MTTFYDRENAGDETRESCVTVTTARAVNNHTPINIEPFFKHNNYLISMFLFSHLKNVRCRGHVAIT